MLKPLTAKPAYVRAVIFGEAKTGKTYAATEFVAEIHRTFKIDAPVCLYSNEHGFRFLRDKIKADTGHEPLIVESKSLDDLLALYEEMASRKLSTLIIDTITPVWQSLCADYLAQVKAKTNGRVKNLRMNDWGVIKGRWRKFVAQLQSSAIHTVIVGRAKRLYEINPKGDAAVVGEGLKAEAELLYECDIAFRAQPEQVKRRDGLGYDHLRVFQCISDRSSSIDSRPVRDPDGSYFAPYLSSLSPKEHEPLYLQQRNTYPNAPEGDDEGRELNKYLRKQLAEELKGVLKTLYPRQTAEDKAARQKLMFAHFQTHTWDAVVNLSTLEQLKSAIRSICREKGLECPKTAKEDVKPDLDPADQVPF